MKRRAFIGLLGASALSMPFVLGNHGLGSGKRNQRISAAAKIPLRLKLPADVTAITALLGEKSKDVFLLGSSAIAAAGGAELPYVNLLIDTQHFSELKQALFESGVTPVSTADLPANFIRFMHQDKGYNVLNMPFDTYTHLSMAGQENGLILFAHNFLMCSVAGGYALDLYEALKTKSGKAFLIKPLQQPKTLLNGFEHCLAATFDCALLGMRPSPEYKQIEERLFESTPNAEESREIMSRILDYTPDILEVGGFETASRLLLSSVCVTAGKTAAEIDFAKVETKLRKLQQQGTEVSGKEFMTAVHAEFKKKTTGKGAAQGLPEYVAATRDQFRRIEVLMDAMEARQA